MDFFNLTLFHIFLPSHPYPFSTSNAFLTSDTQLRRYVYLLHKPFSGAAVPSIFLLRLEKWSEDSPKVISAEDTQQQSSCSLGKSLQRPAENSVFSCLSILVIWFCCCGPAIPLGSLDAQGICAAGFHTEAQTQTQLRSVATSPYHPQLHWGLLIYIKTSFYKWYPLVALLVAPARPRIKRESAAVWSQGGPPHRSALSQSREEASGTYAWWQI